MSRIFFCVAITIFALSTSTLAQSAGAPRIYEVEFERGIFSDAGHVQPHGPCPPAVPQGVCGNSNSRGYSLEGRAGDFVTISLSSETWGAVFSIFTPDGEILKKGSAREWWAGELPSDGDYRINVYTNKSPTAFKVRFTRTR